MVQMAQQQVPPENPPTIQLVPVDTIVLPFFLRLFTRLVDFDTCQPGPMHPAGSAVRPYLDARCAHLWQCS